MASIFRLRLLMLLNGCVFVQHTSGRLISSADELVLQSISLQRTYAIVSYVKIIGISLAMIYYLRLCKYQITLIVVSDATSLRDAKRLHIRHQHDSAGRKQVLATVANRKGIEYLHTMVSVHSSRGTPTSSTHGIHVCVRSKPVCWFRTQRELGYSGKWSIIVACSSVRLFRLLRKMPNNTGLQSVRLCTFNKRLLAENRRR